MIADLKPYPKYKDSGLEWLGQVPSHWELRPAFGAFAPNHERNYGMKEKTVLSLSYGRIVVKPVEKLHGLVPESFETYQIVNPGDIVLRTTDLQNDHTSLRVGMVRERGIITSAYLALRVIGGVCSDFGFQFLNVWDTSKAIYGYGSGLRQNLDFSHFKRMPVPIPPSEEQEAIVRFLNWANGPLERAIRAKRKVIALLNEQKQTIIHGAVTRGLDPSVPVKTSGIPWLGDIPQHWEILALKRVLKRLIDCEHKTAPVAEGSELRVVRTTGIRYGRLVLKGTYGTTHEAFGKWTRRGIPAESDVLFTREAPAGEACIVPSGMQLCLGQRTVLMKLRSDRLESQFLVYTIYGGPPRIAITLASQGSTVGHFNMSDIGSMTILLPPIGEQRAIVDVVQKTVAPIQSAMDRTEREIELLREYRTRLVADVVTGKLDVCEAATHLPDTTESEVPEVDEAELDPEEADEEVVA